MNGYDPALFDEPGHPLHGVPLVLVVAIHTHDFPPASSAQSTCTRCGWTVTLADLIGTPPCPMKEN